MGLKLLICDDNIVQVKSIREFVKWKELGVSEIEVAYDGKEAEELFEEFNPDIVITDIEMPYCDGLQLLKNFKNIKPRIKLVIISCYKKFEYAQAAIEYGADSYMLKPIDFDELRSTSQRIINELKEEIERDEILKKHSLQQLKFERIYEKTGSDKLELTEIRKDILSIFNGVSENEIHLILRKYFKNDEKSENYNKYVCYSIFNTMELILSEKGVKFEDILGNDVSIWDKIDNFDSTFDIEMWVYNLMVFCVKYINELDSDRSVRIVNEIKKVIDEKLYSVKNYEDVVKDIDISVSYAKLIFKKVTGVTIFDYLFAKKMERAKELLRDPYIKVYEIADMLGYKSKTYFSKAFKRYVGVMPNEYRNNNKG